MFGPKRPNFAQNMLSWAHIGLAGSFDDQLVSWLAGVARRLYLARHLFTLYNAPGHPYLDQQLSKYAKKIVRNGNLQKKMSRATICNKIVRKQQVAKFTETRNNMQNLQKIKQKIRKSAVQIQHFVKGLSGATI